MYDRFVCRDMRVMCDLSPTEPGYSTRLSDYRHIQSTWYTKMISAWNLVWTGMCGPARAPLASDLGGRRRNAYKLLCHLRSNRKYKYGGNRKNELAVIDFLFDFNTMYGPIRHRFEARNYFRFR